MLITLKIDISDLLFVTASDTPRSDTTITISSAGPLFGLNQTLLRLRFRNLGKRRDCHVAPRRRYRIETLYWHNNKVPRLGW